MWTRSTGFRSNKFLRDENKYKWLAIKIHSFFKNLTRKIRLSFHKTLLKLFLSWWKGHKSETLNQFRLTNYFLRTPCCSFMYIARTENEGQSFISKFLHQTFGTSVSVWLHKVFFVFFFPPYIGHIGCIKFPKTSC